MSKPWLWIAQLPYRRAGRLLVGALFAIAIMLAPLTDRRSIGIALVALGAIGLLHGWGMLVDWNGMWSRHVQRESQRIRATRELPVARSRAAQAVIELNRRDHEWSRAVGGLSALVVGPIFIVVGTLATAGILELG